MSDDPRWSRGGDASAEEQLQKTDEALLPWLTSCCVCCLGPNRLLAVPVCGQRLGFPGVIRTFLLLKTKRGC